MNTSQEKPLSSENDGKSAKRKAGDTTQARTIDKRGSSRHTTKSAKKPKKGVGAGFVLFGFLLSTLAGAGLGVAAMKYLQGPDKTPNLQSRLNQQEKSIHTTEATFAARLKTFDARLGDISDRLEQIANTQQAALQDKAEAVKTLTDLTSKVETLQTDLQSLQQRQDVIEAMADGQSDLVSGANSISARLQALEDKSTGTNGTNDTNDTKGDGTETEIQTEDHQQLAALALEIEALKTRMEAVDKAQAAPSSPAVEPVRPTIELPKPEQANAADDALNILQSTFPKDAMLAAVRAQERLAKKKPGWLERALAKHIRVRDNDQPDPYLVIASAEKAIMAGEIQTSLSEIEKLNPPVRNAASEWVSAAKKTMRLQERR